MIYASRHPRLPLEIERARSVIFFKNSSGVCISLLYISQNVNTLPTELISKTGNVLLSSNGLKSFNFSGIKDRLLPGKRQVAHTRLEPPKPIQRQIGYSKDPSLTSVSRSSTSDSSSTLANSDIPPGRKSTSSTTTLKSSRRMGSIDSGSGSQRTSDHGHGEESEIVNTPRRKLMSLLHRTGSPRSSPARVSFLPAAEPHFLTILTETHLTWPFFQSTELNLI